jgi:hypothetical protein
MKNVLVFNHRVVLYFLTIWHYLELDFWSRIGTSSVLEVMPVLAGHNKSVAVLLHSRKTVALSTSLMKQQFVVTHTIRQTEIPTLLDIWVANTTSVKIMYPQKKLLLH